jgi:hypothetical protein
MSSFLNKTKETAANVANKAEVKLQTAKYSYFYSGRKLPKLQPMSRQMLRKP